MTARDDLRRAAESLAERGRSPFSPAELIAEARSSGSTYPDSTLRTFIVGPMSINTPDNHAINYGDLVRVGRGQYRLAEAGDELLVEEAGVSEPDGVEVDEAAAPTALGVPDEEWSWEGNVQSAVVRSLAGDGWDIRRVADTASSEQGVDIEAERNGVRLLVEVKGYPSAYYQRGERKGQPKPTNQPLQARHYFAGALLTGMLLRGDDPQAAVVLAFPAFPTYERLARRVVESATAARIAIWLVDQQGRITAMTSETA